MIYSLSVSTEQLNPNNLAQEMVQMVTIYNEKATYLGNK